MKASSTLLLILSLAVTVSSDPGPPVPGALPAIPVVPPQDPKDPRVLIDESCRLVSTFDGRFTQPYCVAALTSVPINLAVKMSIHELASISLDLLKRNVTATREKINGLLAGPGQTNPDLKDCLTHCASMYNEAIDKADNALKAITKNDYTKADLKVCMIQGDGSECEAAFREKNNLPSPLTKENLDCQYLSGMTTLIIRLFDKAYTPWGQAIIKHN